MKRVQQLFWDNDGIFVETEALYFEATRRILSEVGVSLGLEDYRELLLNQARGAWFMAEEAGCDSLRGLRAAKAAGLACWVIPSPMTNGQDFSLADRVLNNIRELTDHLSDYIDKD